MSKGEATSQNSRIESSSKNLGFDGEKNGPFHCAQERKIVGRAVFF